MDEHDFWARLAWRIGSEFAGFEAREFRSYWCDGIVPDIYDLSAPEPQIRGRVWCRGTGQQEWQFTLILDPGSRPGAEIDWPALLPGDDSTGWLSPHPETRTLIIDPLAAYPD
jgi:hypothetical protein